MKNDELIAELTRRTGDETFLGEVITALADQKMFNHIRHDVLEKADCHQLTDFRHESLGCLLLWAYARGDASVLLLIAGAGLEDANFHAEAAQVRAMAGQPA